MRGTSYLTRVLIIVQNLPVPFDRRAWLECQPLTCAGNRDAVVCPKGNNGPAYRVIDGVELHKYGPYAPGCSKLSFAAAFAYSFAATTPKVLAQARGGVVRGRFRRHPGLQPARHRLAPRLALKALERSADEKAGREDYARQIWQLLSMELWYRQVRAAGVGS